MKSILVAGGQLDPNLGRLLRRILQRNVPFLELLVGPDSWPAFSFDIQEQKLTVNGRELKPTACFVRHDVFWRDPGPVQNINWFYAVRGWAHSQYDVRCFNRRSVSGEGNKIQNLLIAREVGLKIPSTRVTNVLSDSEVTLIQKPVSGGEYTTLLSDYLAGKAETKFSPKLLQNRLSRPERRIYRIGEKILVFEIKSEKIDYRDDSSVEVQVSTASDSIMKKFRELCDQIGLDFAAGDFMTDENGELVFLEVNSQPMFVAFDQVSNGALTDAIIDYLLAS